MQVSYNGNIYENKWYTQNQNPEEYSGEYDVWTPLGPYDSSTTTTPTPVSTATHAPRGLKGDVNSDGTVDIIDALVTAQRYVGLPVAIDESAADVNCDSALDIVDELLLAQYYVGFITSFPC
jgi:hypothetical protein